MAVRYVLVDAENNEYRIGDNSFKLLNKAFKIDIKFIEKSFRAGADFPGIQRDQSGEFEFKFDYNTNNEQIFRDYVNLVLFWFRKVIKIKDIINNIQTECFLSEENISYDEGGFNFGSKHDVVFKQLRPFWEDINELSESITDFSNQQTIPINNDGYIEMPVRINIHADEPVTKFSIRVNETREGIVIKDLEFGNNGLNTYIIDTGDGTAELNGLNRNHKIESGTGFFLLPARQVSNLIFNANGQIDVLITYRRRYYI